MSSDIVGLGFVVLGLLLLLGYGIRLKIRSFQKYFIPSSVIAGFLGLFLGPQVLGALTGDNVPLDFEWHFPPGNDRRVERNTGPFHHPHLCYYFPR